jgi:primosomal replication protein N
MISLSDPGSGLNIEAQSSEISLGSSMQVQGFMVRARI